MVEYDEGYHKALPSIQPRGYNPIVIKLKLNLRKPISLIL